MDLALLVEVFETQKQFPADDCDMTLIKGTRLELFIVRRNSHLLE